MLRFPTKLLQTHRLRQYREIVDLDHSALQIVLDNGELCGGNQGECLLELLGQDPVVVFLLHGAVKLEAGLLKKHTVRTGDPQARESLNTLLPKGGKIVALEPDTALFIIRRSYIQSARLDYRRPLSSTSTTSSFQVIDGAQVEAAGEDWMSCLLASPLFARVEPGNMQRLLLSLKSRPYEQGEEVIRAGQPDQYFYIVKSGRARVLLKPPRQREVVLGPGNFFGEGALVGGTVHSASVEMLEAGEICLVAADEFDRLLKASLLHFVTPAQLEQLLRADDPAMVLDVRYAVEHRKSHRPGSLNIPIPALRERMEAELSKDVMYLVDYGDDKRSQVAALILIEHGYNVLLVPSSLSFEQQAQTEEDRHAG
jgi:CRP-like cAMP-binding protein